MDNLLKTIDERIKKELSPRRYAHSVNVMKRCEELAKIYGANIEEAKLVGISHDLAKEMKPEEKIRYVKENNIEADSMEMQDNKILHGKIAADICKKDYSFNDSMCNAIKYHTTGHSNMDLLAKILLLADKTSDDRNFGDAKMIRKLSETNIDKALFYTCKSVIEDVLEKKSLLHTSGLDFWNYLIKERRKKED